MTGKTTSDLALIRRLVLEARGYWRHIVAILLLDALATPIALLTPVPLKIVVDSVLGSEPLPSFLAAWFPESWANASGMLFLAVFLLVLTAILTQVRGLGSSLLRAYAGGKLVLNFRTRLFRHAQRLSLGYHDTKGVTDALYRVQYDTLAIENVVVHGLIALLVSAVTVLAMLYVTARINLQLALVALLVAPAIVVLTRLYRQPLRNRWRKQKKLDHAAMSVLNESFAALRVVKAYSQEEREELRFTGKANESLSQKLKATLLQGSFDIGATLATTVGTAIVLYVGVRAIQAEAMTIGDLIIVMSYIGMLYSPLKTFGKN
ncbi:MAG: ABC transporter transmembrane domain-containing protein, partial [Gammaproteobacteria bacterium]